jgi:hypothetical protein
MERVNRNVIGIITAGGKGKGMEWKSRRDHIISELGGDLNASGVDGGLINPEVLVQASRESIKSATDLVSVEGVNTTRGGQVFLGTMLRAMCLDDGLPGADPNP